MRKFLVAAALTGAVATGLSAAPAAQAATDTTASSTNWGNYFSSNGKAYSYGRTYKSGGYVHTYWYGKEKFGGDKKYGYVWFEYYKDGSWHKFSRFFNGKGNDHWSKRDVKKIYTYTCWGSTPFKYCGGKHRIY
ncbi:hypothetical protein OIE66_36010 [Nonomuraea sp. NBC_01738]|uniref:hypothetical protein n=1 Tax=Nonomuraea sp. NBC_01738 TaxID=2976003 RepID=UPI002E0E04B0|nr:hypothetical protein OIE66_36010 [Nonomuraea sp. NBC_01738]